VSNVTRPSSSNNYEEQYVVPLEASRRGAHRARVSPVMAALPVAAVALVVIGAIFVVYSLFSGTGDKAPGSDAMASVSPTASASSPVAEQTQPASSDPGGSPTTSPEAAGEIDKSITIDVFNGTSPSVSGLARKALPKITGAGWRTGQVATWNGSPVTVTTIYYSTAEQKATAQALAKAIGRGSAKMSPGKVPGGEKTIAVVVGNDYPGAKGRSTRSQSTRRSATRTASTEKTAKTATKTAEPDSEAPPQEDEDEENSLPSPTD
jgi:hypothetical protein